MNHPDAIEPRLTDSACHRIGDVLFLTIDVRHVCRRGRVWCKRKRKRLVVTSIDDSVTFTFRSAT